MQKNLYLPLLKAVPACLAMAVAVFVLIRSVDWLQPGMLLHKSLLLAAAVMIGILVYLGCCYLLGLDEVRQAWRLFWSRGKKR